MGFKRSQVQVLSPRFTLTCRLVNRYHLPKANGTFVHGRAGKSVPLLSAKVPNANIDEKSVPYVIKRVRIA
jgi:hypothetical protein